MPKRELTAHERSLLRAANTASGSKHNIGGTLKTKRAPKPVTLPPVPWENEDDLDNGYSGGD